LVGAVVCCMLFGPQSSVATAEMLHRGNWDGDETLPLELADTAPLVRVFEILSMHLLLFVLLSNSFPTSLILELT
jgi:hypothetical protein